VAVYTQRRGDRCTGMKIDREDGSIDILGQWDPANKQTITLLFEKTIEPLPTVSFVFSDAQLTEFGIRQYMMDIQLVPANLEGEVRPLGLRIPWGSVS
jgi:hypothetical protein